MGTGSDRDFLKSDSDVPTPSNGTSVSARTTAFNTDINSTLGDEWIGGRDMDTYALSLTAGERYVVRGIGQNYDMYVRLFNPSFTVIGQSGEGSFGLDGIDFHAPTTGTYYLVVSTAENLADPRVITGRTSRPSMNYSLAVDHVDPRPDVFAEATFSYFSATRVEAAFSIKNGNRYVTATNVNVAFYLSDDAAITTSDVLLKSMTVDATAIDPYEVDVDLPYGDPFRTDNQYYVGLIVDPSNTIAEVDETNNDTEYTARSSEGHLPSPLTGTSIIATPFPAQNLSVHDAIGDEEIGAYDIDAFSISAKAGETLGFVVANFSSSYLRLYDSNFQLLGGNSSGTPPVVVPGTPHSYLSYTFSTAGTYYLIVSDAVNSNANPRVLSGRTTGATGSYDLYVLKPDLVVSGVNTDTAVLPANGHFTVSYQVQNSGGSPSPATTVAFYLSADAFITPGTDTLLDSKSISALGIGQTISESMDLITTAPDPFRTNNAYFIGVIADPSDAFQEYNEFNTAKTAIRSEANLNAGAISAPSLATNTAVSGDIGGDEWIGAYDIDAYSITAVANQRIAFDLDRTSGSLDSYIRVYNSSLTLLASNDNGAAPGETIGSDSYLEFTFATAGTYYLIVSSKDNATAAPNTLAGRVAGSTGAFTLAAIQSSPPRVSSATFDYLASLDVALQMNENLSGIFTGADVTLLNRTASETYPANVAFDIATNLASVTFPGQPENLLPDGNYRMTVNAAGVVDNIGNALDGNSDGTGGDNFTFDFFFLNADANRDRVVNALDFNALASNFGASATTFAQGNFNYDAQVNTLDFNVLATHFNAALPSIAAQSIAPTIEVKSLFSSQAVSDPPSSILQEQSAPSAILRHLD